MKKISLSELTKLFERVAALESKVTDLEGLVRKLGAEAELSEREIASLIEVASEEATSPAPAELAPDLALELEDIVEAPEPIVAPTVETPSDIEVRLTNISEANTAPAQAVEPITPPVPQPQAPEPTPAERPEWVKSLTARLSSVEFWFNTLGIGLLLFGLVFAYLYAVGQGWITDPIRLGLGYSIAVTLLGTGIGFGLMRDRPFLGQVLAGGGIAAVYISTYAGYAVYELMSYSVATGIMTLATAIAFGIAVWQKRPVMAHIGLIGGLLTPFILPTETGSVPGLFSYTGIILAGALAIYFVQRWAGLFVMAMLGAGIIFILGLALGSDLFSDPLVDRPAFTGMLLFLWLGFGLLPVGRVLMDANNSLLKVNPETDTPEIPWYALAASILVPFGSGIMLPIIWAELGSSNEQLYRVLFGSIFLLLGVAYTLGGRWLAGRHSVFETFSTGFLLIAISAVTAAFGFFFQGEILFIILVMELIAIHYLASTSRSTPVAILGHLFAMLLSLFWLIVLATQTDGDRSPFWNDGFIPLTIFILGLLAVSYLMKRIELREVYRLAAFAFAMVLIAVEFSLYDSYSASINGIMWGWLIFSFGIFMAGWRQETTLTRGYGLIGIGLALLAGFIGLVQEEAALPVVWLIVSTSMLLGLVTYGDAVDRIGMKLIGLPLIAITAIVSATLYYGDIGLWSWLVVGGALLVVAFFFDLDWSWAAAFAILTVTVFTGSFVLQDLTLPGLLLFGMAIVLLGAGLISDLFANPFSVFVGNSLLLFVTILALIQRVDMVDEVAFYFLNGSWLGTLALILAAVFIVWQVLMPPVKWVIALLVHALFLWLLAIDGGQISTGLVSALWGIYAIGLVIYGLVENKVRLRWLGLGTLFVVVAKLFLVDLSDTEPIVRVLLFGGLGALLLLVSYFLGPVWRRLTAEDGQELAASE